MSEFLTGDGIPVALPDVENELARLWSMSGDAAEGDDGSPVTRVSLSNLVIGCLDGDGASLGDALDLVVAQHPSRVIILRRTDCDDRAVAASVSARCSLPAPGSPQVCSEHIVLSAGARGVDLLPGAVRPLLESDLPLVLWWVGDPRTHEGVFRDLANEATRLIADLPDPGADHAMLQAALDPTISGNRLGRDLAWFGISRWRELVAAFFDPPGDATLPLIKAVEIVSKAREIERPARVGAWLGAWLAGQLGWKPGHRRQVERRVEARFETAGGPVDLILVTEHDAACSLARVDRVGVHARASEPSTDDRFELVRVAGSDQVRIETCSRNRCALGRVVRAVEPDRARRVAAALESSRNDPPYGRALPLMQWLIGDK